MKGETPPALLLDRVSKRFGAHQVVRELSLRVGAGELVALLGPNGAGKSTTLSMILGFATPDEGRIEVAGLPVPGSVRQARALIGYIPEQVQLYPTLTGVESLAYFLALGGETPPTEALRQALLDVGLPAEAHDRRTATYSKGMRQRVGIAIALQRRCRLLLLDEPSSGLDAGASVDFHTQLRRIAAIGVGVLMATHDLFRARAVADRVALLRDGRLVAQMDRAAFLQIDLEEAYLQWMREVE